MTSPDPEHWGFDWSSCAIVKHSTYNKLLSLVALSAVSVSFALLLPHVLISFSSPVTLYGHNLSFLFVCAFAAAHTALLLISQAHPSLSLLHF